MRILIRATLIVVLLVALWGLHLSWEHVHAEQLPISWFFCCYV